MKDKKVLTIQDISCVGQCSLTVALPIISACGIETCILPSAVLSTHTGGFTGYTFRDLTDDFPGITEHWKKEGISFDCVYTGYLGSTKQIEYASRIMNELLDKDGLRIVDPAMADNGHLYFGFDDEYVTEMTWLCGRADIILPNITEACFITNSEYIPDGYDKEYIRALLKKLAALGAGKVILTGVSFKPNELGVAVYDSAKDDTRFYFHERLPGGSHGTGDVYASAFTGALMRGLSVFDAAKLAADYTVKCILITRDDNSHWYGVKFEKALPMLLEKLEASVNK